MSCFCLSTDSKHNDSKARPKLSDAVFSKEVESCDRDCPCRAVAIALLIVFLGSFPDLSESDGAQQGKKR